MQRRLESLTLGVSAIHAIAALSCAFVLQSQAAMVKLYGLLANAILLAYYSAPLSSLAKVVRTRSAASIYLPTVLLNGLNGVDGLLDLILDLILKLLIGKIRIYTDPSRD